MIKLHRIQKSYGANQALAGLDLEIRPGEIFGLLGPNGAGKSTAMHVICGLLLPDSGYVSLFDGAPTDIAMRQRLGLAPQSVSLYELLTGRENLEFFGRLYGLEAARLRERVDLALDFVRLTDRQNDRAGTYSGGMQRRLNIAAAMVHDPDVMLLDEPTVGVDPQSRNAIFDNVLALKARGKTVIYTTHYMEEAERLCDRIAIVDHGRVLAQGTLDELIDQYGGPSTLVVRRARGADGSAGVELREVAVDPLARINELAAAAPIAEFRLDRPTLEQVFLKLTGRSLRD